MISSCVIDANVAIKIVTRENNDIIDDALSKYGSITAPDYLQIECASILTRKVRRKLLKPIDAEEAFNFLHYGDANIDLFPSVNLLSHAFGLSIGLHLTLYDCIYLSLAIEKSVPFLTFDQAIKKAIHGDSFLDQHVILLKESNYT